MKKIIQIARLELSVLFYSPIAWLLLIIFFAQCGLAYTSALQGWLMLQELGGGYGDQVRFMTLNVFGPARMTGSIVANFYLYLPLLTMGLISREISSGTIKLLYSSPIKTSDIVFGKFLSVCVYGLLFIAVYGVFMGLGTIHLPKADIGLLFAILLGVFLLLCSYGAIGLFVSCLTSYQVVAAIGTFVIFAFLNFIGSVGQDIDFMRDLTYSLSLSGRIQYMASGLITTKDLCYFIMIIGVFVGFTILRLQATRSTDTVPVKALKYFAFVFIALIIGYITSRPAYTAYLDATEPKVRTLTKTSQAILKEMDEGPLEITSYINLLDERYWDGQPILRNSDLERWLPYLRFKPDIELKYVYYYDSVPNPDFYKQYGNKSLDEIALKYANGFGIDLDKFKKPEEIRKIIDLRPEKNRYVMHLKYNGKSTFLRLFNDTMVFPSEVETGAALKRLIVKLPKVVFLEGELERSASKEGDRDYKRMTSQLDFRYSLMNQGFDFTTVSLRNNEIPSDASVLVIADPKENFASGVLMKIQKFIDEGGNLLIMGEPGKQSILNPLLKSLGVSMTEGMIVQQSQDFSPSLVLTYLTPASAGFSKRNEMFFRDSSRVSVPTVTGLLYDGEEKFEIQPLLITDERYAWRKMQSLSADSLKVNFSADDGDEKGKFITMLGLKRKMSNGSEQRIIVSSDADFMSSIELVRNYPATANFSFNTELFGWLSNGEFPLDAIRPDPKDKTINLKGSDLPMLKAILIWIIPFAFFIIGTVLLVRRRKQ